MGKLLLGFWLVLATALPVFADNITDEIIANLKAQGYHVVQQDRTWLGRMWILARSDTMQREVVFNPGTGEVLRDYVVTLASLQQNGHPESGNPAVSKSAIATAGQDPGGASVAQSAPDAPDLLARSLADPAP